MELTNIDYGLDKDGNPLSMEEIMKILEKDNELIDLNIIEKDIPKVIEQMSLSPSQQAVMDVFKTGKNIFLTGGAGSGKSFLIKQLKQNAEDRRLNIAVTALTGTAAQLLDCKARTLHSWAGIGLAKDNIGALVYSIRKSKSKSGKWLHTQILIVDEVSMLSPLLFDKLDIIGREIRKVDKPFGGIQLVFVGDFFQLPPVERSPNNKDFCFSSDKWFETFPLENHMMLKEIFRQKEKDWAELLNRLRVGRIKKSDLQTLNNIVAKSDINKVCENGFIPTKLFPIRMKVDKTNREELNKILLPSRMFDMKEIYDLPMTPCEQEHRSSFSEKEIEWEINKIKESTRCDDKLELKEGAQVMCLINMDLGNDKYLTNGSQGIIKGFDELNQPIIHFTNGIIHHMAYNVWESDKIPGIGVSQLPLTLAWAVTIHKSQGATLDYATIDAGKEVFACGQTYVALSRVKTKEGLNLVSFDVSKVMVSNEVIEFYNKFS